MRVEKKGFLPGVQRVEARAGETLKVTARLQVDDTRVSRPAPAADGQRIFSVTFDVSYRAVVIRWYGVETTIGTKAEWCRIGW